MTTQAILPMSLGDIFDRLIKLIGKTWLRNLIVAVLILILPALILGFSMNGFFSHIGEIARQQSNGGEVDPQGVFEMLGHMTVFFLGLLLFMLASGASTIGVTAISCSEMSGQEMGWQEAIRRSFSVRFARLIGMSILRALAFGGMIAIPYILIIVAIAIKSIGFGLLAGLLLVVGGCFALYIGIRWSFVVPAIAWEDAGVMASFRRSWMLVKENWWRVLGILILLGLITSFAVSLVMTPVYIAAFWNFFTTMFERIGTGEVERPDPTVFLEAFRSFGLSIGFVTGLSAILEMLISPLYVVVLYFDLRARKGEFDQAATNAVTA